MSENNEFTFENEQYRKTYWHTCSHVLAQAVKRLHPEVKLAIGPAIDNGFYYDFDAPFTFTPGSTSNLPKLSTSTLARLSKLALSAPVHQLRWLPVLSN